ncbi:hypothetical protein AWJ14_13465 [Hoeflea olei]|uniref:Uncharacterized protein n=2 Tax=Hoeflea olei TaxID=1480615 RepID=A0A1C1YXY9_9HYPH|nr:hypothetical protein AWJ14_13465 [Hoeflea olei]
MALFAADVVAGAFFRAAFLTDLQQAVLLALSCSFFVAGLLIIEAGGARDTTSAHNGEEETR